MGKSTRFWVILFLAVAALSCVGYFLARSFTQTSCIAAIYLDGELYQEIDLNAVAVPYTLEIQTQYGENVLLVSHGEIAVERADCPDQVCVRQGAISESLIPIVCLPHRLVIQIEEALP